MPFAIVSISGAFAGPAAGVDCARPLEQPDIGAIDAATERYGVLVFRDQPLTDEQQIAFSRRFGELERYETPGHIRKRQDERLGAGVADFSNLAGAVV